MSSTLRRCRTWSSDERSLFLQSVALFPLVAIATKWRGARWTQNRLAAYAARAARRRRARPLPVRRVIRLSLLAARCQPWTPNCLQRALVVWWALRAHGEEGLLKIGVRKLRDAGPDFQAWVELDGRVVTDLEEEVATYTAFEGAITPREAHGR